MITKYITAIKTWYRGSKKDERRLFAVVPTNRPRDNEHHLKHKRYSKPDVTQSWSTCCSWIYFKGGRCTRRLPDVPSNLNNSVIVFNLR